MTLLNLFRPTIEALKLRSLKEFAAFGQKYLFESSVCGDPTFFSRFFKDFACLAENSALRRADFYTLSQPGGHPRNWGEVVTKCLGLIKEFSKDLNEASKQAVTVIPR